MSSHQAMNNVTWIVDDDSSIRWVLEKALASAGIPIESFANADLLLQRLSYEKPAVIVSDIRMPGIDGMELLNRIKQQYPEIPIIIMTAHSDLESAVSAYKSGAFEYLPKPFDIDEAITLVQRALEQTQAKQSKAPQPPVVSTEIIGEAPAMQEVFRAIGRLSRSSISVLINGESGTGKELVAQALHQHSPRASSPFIALNMAAIPKELIESELFGHEKGAFTGAQTIRQGRFEQADSGTLFLDEIGDMPLEVQTRLLRVLAEGQFYRVGGHSPIKVDVRIIAATHQDLEELVRQGKFREDLFHRLNVIRVQIPRLKERSEDIKKLAAHFLAIAAKEIATEPKTISKSALDILSNFEWPGNVRQLENTCRWLTVMASGKEIQVTDLPEEIRQPNIVESNVNGSGKQSWQEMFEQTMEQALRRGDTNLLDNIQYDFERILLTCALKHTAGRKQEAAKRIGWGRNTLTRKLKELNVDPKNLD